MTERAPEATMLSESSDQPISPELQISGAAKPPAKPPLVGVLGDFREENSHRVVIRVFSGGDPERSHAVTHAIQRALQRERLAPTVSDAVSILFQREDGAISEINFGDQDD